MFVAARDATSAASSTGSTFTRTPSSDPHQLSRVSSGAGVVATKIGGGSKLEFEFEGVAETPPGAAPLPCVGVAAHDHLVPAAAAAEGEPKPPSKPSLGDIPADPGEMESRRPVGVP